MSKDWRHVVSRVELDRLRNKATRAVEETDYVIAMKPQTVLALLNYIDELEERAGEKDPENG